MDRNDVAPIQGLHCRGRCGWAPLVFLPAVSLWLSHGTSRAFCASDIRALRVNARPGELTPALHEDASRRLGELSVRCSRDLCLVVVLPLYACPERGGTFKD